MSLMIGIPGEQLDHDSRGWLRQSKVAALILFARNYRDQAQLASLLAEVRTLRPDIIVAVDQEGGPVQRLREGFQTLPALNPIGTLYEKGRERALKACRLHARLMASEVLAHGIDLSLAPVADLARGNRAIGTRAFSADPGACAHLTAQYVRSMQALGMAATLKHFPGHGSVLEDTHVDTAVDARSVPELLANDLWPFAIGIAAGARAVMMGHVCYPAVDARAAGYSRAWLVQILRAHLGFLGIVMGDDVSMAAGASAGAIGERVLQHYLAGCDLVLACQPDAVEAALAAPCVTLGAREVSTLRATPDAMRRARHERSRFPLWSDELRRLLDA